MKRVNRLLALAYSIFGLAYEYLYLISYFMGGSAFFGSMAALGGAVSFLFMFASLLAFYIGTSYGIYLLAKKYEPQIHPALSWIPLVNVYTFIKISGQSAWWIL